MEYSLCPLMSRQCETIDSESKAYACTGDCALYDHDIKGCCVHSILGELVKLNERE